MNIFESASRQALRFESPVGMLTVENLWDLPLTARGTKTDLDTVAKLTNQALKSVTEESFVSVKENPNKRTYELRLEIVKYIISEKLAQEEIQRKVTATRERKQQLLELLAEKDNEAMKGLTREEILSQLESMNT